MNRYWRRAQAQLRDLFGGEGVGGLALGTVTRLAPLLAGTPAVVVELLGTKEDIDCLQSSLAPVLVAPGPTGARKCNEETVTV